MKLTNKEYKKYIQLYNILKNKIENKEWLPGSKIPTEEQLCETFKVSRSTVRNALIELVRQGYLIRQQGRGTFVNKNFLSQGLTMTTNLNQLWVKDDLPLKKEILVKTILMSVGDLSKEFEIEENKHIIYIKIRWINGQESPILQEILIPLNICPKLMDEDEILEQYSIFELLAKRYKIIITKILNYIEITLSNKEIASNLGISENTPLLLLTQKIYSEDAVIMLNKIYKMRDRGKLFISFYRKVI